MTFGDILHILEMVRYATRILGVIGKLEHGLGPENHNPSQAKVWTDLCLRLWRLRLALIIILILNLSTLVPLLAVHIILGSVPYGFVLLF